MEKPTDKDKVLQDAKSLTRNVTSGDQSLEDILAEYGAPSAGQRAKKKKKKRVEAPPKVEQVEDNIIPFPTPEDAPIAQKEKKNDPLNHLFPKQERPRKAAPVDPLNHLFTPTEPEPEPEEEHQEGGMFAGLLNSIDRRVQRMYEEEEELDPDEVRRLEELIPGTDLEDEEDDEDYATLRERLGWETPPPPDTPPRELAGQYFKGLFSLRLRGWLVLLLAIISLIPTFLPLFDLKLPPQITADPRYLLWGYAGLLGLGMLLSMDLILMGLWRGLKLKIGFDTLMAISAWVSLADCLYLSFHFNAQRSMPYAPITLIALWCLLHGGFHKRMAQHMSCRSAAAAKTPYLVTLDERKWNAMDTYCKWSGAPVGFGSQMQMDDGGQKFFSLICPFLLLGCLFPLLKGGDTGTVLWRVATNFTVACALGAPLCYGRSARKIEERLTQSGATLAGWSGAKESKKGSRVLLTDGDLFPHGSISAKPPRCFNRYTDAKVVAYTASLLIAADCGLTPVFANLLRGIGGLPRKVENPLFHEGGGISGHVWHDDVLVGTASFMNLMGVALKPGLHVNQTVFCSINGELAGMFPLNYSLPATVAPAVYTLLGEDIAPILATRDFNLIPATLSGRFNLPADQMDFPVIERRRELSHQEGLHNNTITAVLCREGLLPFAEAVVAAKRLRIATRLAGTICALSSVLGIALTTYLTGAGAYSSASPVNLLIYLLMWSAPVWFLTEWSHRF